ncbi:zonular occludens toxin domain-containing protein [Salinisphaera sp. SPP-AMP-43]|uniref:zonular occludens toxin domain-containing protein n=1 Tax=Salinisphaera sp. SPP-AMP-43 TaxID=3121288 RepID=UPI003C6DF1BC
MAITAYTGRPGAGKSYGVVANVVLPALENGRRVWTNIPLKLDVIRESYPNADVTVFETRELEENPAYAIDVIPKGSIVIIDEAWRLWPAGMKPAQVPNAYKTFLAEHRHRVGDNGESMEIVIVTQDLSQIATFARDLTDKTFIAEKLDTVGASKRFKLVVCQGAVKGDSPPSKRYIRTIQGKYKSEVYRYYQSHTLADSSSGEAGLEVAADGRANILKGSFFIVGVPVAGVGALFGLYLAWGAFTSISGGDEKPEKQAATSSVPTQKQLEQPRPAPTQPKDSDDYRLVGTIVAGSYKRAIVYGENGSRRIGMSSCDRFGDTGDWYCFIDGRRVTSWTGPKPPDSSDDSSLLSSLTQAS